MTNNKALINAASIESEIDGLNGGHWIANKRQYQEFSAHCRVISDMFKTLKPLLKEDRERLKAKFEAVRDLVRKEQETNRTASKNERALIEAKINEAFNQAKGAHCSLELSGAVTLLDKALDWMNNGRDGLPNEAQAFKASVSKLTKEDGDFCWERWNETNEIIKNKRREFFEVSYYAFRSKARNARNDDNSDTKQPLKSKTK